MNAFLFHQNTPFERLRLVQISLSIIVTILLLFGPYDDFYVQLSPWLYEPQFPFYWFPDLGSYFWALKFAV